MTGLLRAGWLVAAASLERVAVKLHEDALAYPRRQFYRGYEQGLRDRDAEHAKRWLGERGGRRQAYPSE